jgi:hypothetical protein
MLVAEYFKIWQDAARIMGTPAVDLKTAKRFRKLAEDFEEAEI